MASFALLAIVGCAVGIAGAIAFVLWLSRSIKREDHFRGALRVSRSGAPDLGSRVARRCSGLHVRGGDLTPAA
jgi:hypothetical protein